MKASAALIIFFLFAVNSVLAQADFDSVISSLENKPDSIKIKKLNELSLKLRGQNPQLAIRLASTAKDIGEKGNCKTYLAESFNIIGVVYRNLGDLTVAMRYHQQALIIAKEMKDRVQIAYSHNNISVVHREASNYTLAFEDAISAIRIFEQLNDNQGLAFTYINLGNIFTEQNIYNEALKYYQKALEIRRIQKEPIGLGQALGLIANTYFKLNKTKDALDTYFETEKICNQTENKRGLAQTWNGIAKVLTLQNKFNVAIEYRKKSLKLFNELQYIDESVITSGQLSILYAKTKNFSLGQKHISDAVNLNTKIKSRETKIELYRMAGEFYEICHRNDSSLFYYKKYMHIKDSVQYNANVSKFAEIEALYLNDKAIKENTILSKDIEANKHQTIYLILIIFLVIFIAVLTYTRFNSMRETNKKLNELNAMKDTFFRIIAHDLKSPFNAVFGYLSIMKTDYNNLSDEEKLFFINSIDGAIGKSYQLLEQLLLWSRSNTGKLEFNPVELDIEKIINDNIHLLTPVAAQKDITLAHISAGSIKIKADEEMIKTVIRNFVSNSIKFTNPNGKVEVISGMKGKSLLITIKDNGVGMNEEQSKNLFRIDKSSSTTGTKGEQGTGLGLIICKEFVDKHNGKITVESVKGEGTKFTISLPL